MLNFEILSFEQTWADVHIKLLYFTLRRPVGTCQNVSKAIICASSAWRLGFLPRSWIILENLEFLAKILDFFHLLTRSWISFIRWQDPGFLRFLVHARVAFFWVFKDNCLWDIYRSCITLMQDFLVSLVKILVILAFVDKNSKFFLGIFSTILKNLAKSCEPCQD